MSSTTNATGTYPTIGIVPTQIPSEGILRVNSHYVDAVEAAGGIPIIMPLTNNIHVYEKLLPQLDGFILTGGQDLSPELYGKEQMSKKLSETTPEREEVEAIILTYAYDYDAPVLGICRGMQMMNVFFGGTLYQDLSEEFTPFTDDDLGHYSPNHWQDEDYGMATHFVNIVRESKLSEILNAESVPTNSMHHQGVRDVAPLLDVAAYGTDGLVEAIEARDRSFIMGVQWHPEFFAGRKRMGCLFSSLIRHASEFRTRQNELGVSPRVGKRASRPSPAPWTVGDFGNFA